MSSKPRLKRHNYRAVGKKDNIEVSALLRTCMRLYRLYNNQGRHLTQRYRDSSGINLVYEGEHRPCQAVATPIYAI